MGYMLPLVSKAKKFFISTQTKKKKALFEEKKMTVAGFGAQSPGLGCKDIFLDTQVCFESDCEDDFFSVNGEFTPSRGNTPNHQTIVSSVPRVEETILLDTFPVSATQPSPTGRKKLLELLSEKQQSKGEGDAFEESGVATQNTDDSTTNFGKPLELLNGTPKDSGFRSSKVKKERSWKNAQCCLPSLQSFGHSERKQKMSPRPCMA